MPVAVISLGLLSALTWGVGDFGGGVISRRAPVAGVLLLNQVGGAVLALVAALLLRERSPHPSDLVWALLSSSIGGLGLACLYIGLARGRMGVVAPVAGVLVSAIPAVGGIVTQGAPPTLALVGIALAMSSVVVVSRVGDAGDGRPSGLRWGIGAGLGLGIAAITLSRLTPGNVFGPLTVMRFGEAALIGLVILASRSVGPARRRAGAPIAWRLPRQLWAAVVLVGACDMLGTAFYIAATQAGPLAIAGVLSALYPVTTVVLAVTILRERLASWHLVGVAMAAVAIVLITTGGAV